MQPLTISLLFNAHAQANDAILAWVKMKNYSNPAFIVDDDNTLKITPFPYSLYSLSELISIDSSIEEGIYQRCHHYRKFFSQKFPFRFEGINLFEDEVRNHNFELPMRYLAAYLKVAHTCESVVIAISSETIYFRILLQSLLQIIQKHQLGKLDAFLIFNPKKNTFETAKTSFYGYHGKLFWNTLWRQLFATRIARTATTPVREQQLPLSKKSTHSHSMASKPCFLLTTTAPLYRNNFSPVYKVLCEKLSKKPAILAEPYAMGVSKGGECNSLPLVSQIRIYFEWLIQSRKQFPRSAGIAGKPLAIAIRSDVEKTAEEDNIECISLRKKRLKWLSVKFALTLLNTYPRWVVLKFIYLFKLRSQKFNKNLLVDIFRSQMNIFLAHNGLLFRLFQSALNTKKLNDLLLLEKPSVIYKDVSRSLYDVRIAQLAKKHEIPIVASIVASLSSRYRSFGIYPCDFITLLGETQKIILKKRGYSDAQMICVGQPELDAAKKIWDLSAAHRYLSNIIFDFQPDVFTILIATGYIDLASEKAWITILCAYAEQQPFPIQILLKPHPSVFGFYETLEQLPCLTLLSANISLYPCLVAANLVVTDVSHAGKLAVFFKKALMVINFSGKKFPFNRFDEENVAWLAKNSADIYRIVEGVHSGDLCIEPAAYDNYIRRHLTNKDGKAAERIVDFLLSFPSYNDKAA